MLYAFFFTSTLPVFQQYSDRQQIATMPFRIREVQPLQPNAIFYVQDQHSSCAGPAIESISILMVQLTPLSQHWWALGHITDATRV